jgi:hypothetical protein
MEIKNIYSGKKHDFQHNKHPEYRTILCLILFTLTEVDKYL